jgi:polyisoprenoid-binding protein YceI
MALLRAQPRNLRVAPVAGSEFKLEVEKTGLLKGKKHIFKFEKYGGVLAYDVQMPEKSRIELEIESASATLHDDWVNDKDKKKVLAVTQTELLESGKYPKLKFVSEKITAKGAGSFEVLGKLTIRNITNAVTVAVTQNGEVYAGMAKVKLTDYKLKPPSAALGAVGTKDEMTVSFVLKPGM